MMGNDLLLGEKVRLTPPHEDDLDLMTRWFSTDFEMMRRLGQHPIYPMSRQDEEDWLQSTRKDQNNFLFAIRTLAENDLLGTTSIFNIDWRSGHGELGIALGAAERRGQGFGSDAVRVLLRYGFMELNLHRVYLRVHSDNPRAIRVYEKTGFVHEGATREVLLRDNRAIDVIWMGILQSEWRAA